MPEATLSSDSGNIDQIADAAYVSGQVVQLADGRAAVKAGLAACAIGDTAAFQTSGIFELPKTASINLLDGQEVFWDHSANTATYTQQGNDRDFLLGVAVGDSLAAATTVRVNLNVAQVRIIDLQRTGWDTTIVKTVVGSTTVEVPQVFARGGSTLLTFGTTAEAQKVDLMSSRSFANASAWIVEGIFNIITNSDNAAGDINIGVASGTHATDFDAISECMAIHIDGASLVLNAQSDDNVAAVAAATTGVSATAGTPVHFVMDGRNSADIQLYINGANVLPSTVFKTITGPLFAIVHAEKTSDDSPLTFRVDKFTVRTMEQTNAA